MERFPSSLEGRFAMLAKFGPNGLRPIANIIIIVYYVYCLLYYFEIILTYYEFQ